MERYSYIQKNFDTRRELCKENESLRMEIKRIKKYQEDSRISLVKLLKPFEEYLENFQGISYGFSKKPSLEFLDIKEMISFLNNIFGFALHNTEVLVRERKALKKECKSLELQIKELVITNNNLRIKLEDLEKRQ